jgi:hypothetical protein
MRKEIRFLMQFTGRDDAATLSRFSRLVDDFGRVKMMMATDGYISGADLLV